MTTSVGCHKRAEAGGEERLRGGARGGEEKRSSSGADNEQKTHESRKGEAG